MLRDEILIPKMEVPYSVLEDGTDFLFIYVRGCIQNFRTGLLKRELQMVQFSATRCSCFAILESV